jgi:hypothetical protein
VAWYLNNALTTFRNEVNAAYPLRDKTSDGTIGDEAHQGGSSDHNPDSDESVDAWDMDVEVNGKGAAYSADVEELKDCFEAHEAAQYWIHNRIIANRDDGWARRSYSGSNPHDKHVHWNSRSSHEDSTKPWGVDQPMTRDEFLGHMRAAMDDPSTRDRFERNTVTYPIDSGYNTLSLFYDIRDALAALQTLATGLYAPLGAQVPELPPPGPRRPPQGEPDDAAPQ